MSMLHVYHSKVPYSLIKSKPFVVVSAKGISNGLSDTYNDGADFGPDTLLNATAPGQYGPPFTQTVGIQEAINYIQAKGGGDVEVQHGAYTATTNIVITGSNIRLRGHGRPTLNMNYNQITNNNTSGQSNVEIKNFVMNNAGITFNSGNVFVYPPQNSHLKLRNIVINNNVQGVSPLYVAINGWFDALLEDFYLYDNGKPSSNSDAMGIGSNVRFVWNRGYVYTPSMGGAAINWQSNYFSTSTPPAQVDLAGFDVAPWGTTGADAVNYDFINVGLVGDVNVLSVYPEAWSIRFRGCEFTATFNSGTTFAPIAIQQTGSDMNFDITIEDSIIKSDPQNTSQIGYADPLIEALGFSSDVYITLKNVEVQNFSNYGASIVELAGGSFYHIIVDGLKIIDFGTAPMGALLLNAMNNNPAYDALFNNVEYMSVNGYVHTTSPYSTALFVLSPGGQFEKIIARNISVRSAVALASASGNQWAVTSFNLKSGTTADAEGSLIDVEVNGRRFVAPLDNLVFSGQVITSTEQVPHFYVTPSTPAVPASGTAQMNTNPYMVEVYLNGGSATEVQVTRGKTTYTVWSSSSATAIPPLTIRLNPGDSITLTYTTAPTWTWAAA